MHSLSACQDPLPLSHQNISVPQLAIANIIRSISTIFFVIVSSFSTTTGSLVSNRAPGKNQIMPLCRKIIHLGYLLGIPLIVIACYFPTWSWYLHPDRQLIQLAFWPLSSCHKLHTLLPAHVFTNAAVLRHGKPPVRHLSTNVSRSPYTLFYLSCINRIGDPLAVYWTSGIFTYSFFFMVSPKRTNEKS